MAIEVVARHFAADLCRVRNGAAGEVARYSNTVRALNTWYHVAGVFDAAKQTLDILRQRSARQWPTLGYRFPIAVDFSRECEHRTANRRLNLKGVIDDGARVRLRVAAGADSVRHEFGGPLRAPE